MKALARALAAAAVAAGVAFNRWTLERFVVFDGEIGSLAVDAAIAAAQIALIGGGIALWRSAARVAAPSPTDLLLVAVSVAVAAVGCELATSRAA